MNEQGSPAFELARQRARRSLHAIEEAGRNLTVARDQAEAELRRRWELLRDAVESALASGVSFEDVARWLGLAPATLDDLLSVS